MKSSDAISLLNQCHSFPGLYVFKLIGDNTSRFCDAVWLAVLKELGGAVDREGRLSTRESSRGRYLSVTLKLEMESAEQVLRLYERFSKLRGLKTIM